MITLLNASCWTFSGLSSLSLCLLDSYTFVLQASWFEDDEEFSSWPIALEAYEDAKFHLEYCSQVWANAQVDKLEAKLGLEVDETFMARQLEQALVRSELILVKAWEMWETCAFEQVELYSYAEYQILASYSGDVQVFAVYLNSVQIDHDSWDCCDGWYPSIQEWILDWVKLNR